MYSNIGQKYKEATHLITRALKTAKGEFEKLQIYGTDFITKDGTGVRDYIHINDLCTAHDLALNSLLSKSSIGASSYNLGNGNGFSVEEVIAVVKKVVAEDGYSLDVKMGERRLGDPATLVADATLLTKELNWLPNYNDLEAIIRHAWAWEKRCVQH